ncbi:hypothetical protein QUB80_10320 [Chlorogloeopsis sp. ULAP01]|uniref:hypothetical protein n=1 Tax=Chlorogloeopsis sp. ULAP01 TaxID=3056483 RepID=UPI0025AB3582|nr:hypothetical protein [Chlorogloeopsis sp. ULAP01]MDM9381098.1 hypothetical protein [Chlorogloeopsis sp. ULAP01]
MADGLSNLIYGVIGGGIFTFMMKVTETYLIAPRLQESIEARKKLDLYAKPLWLACHELEFRLISIKDKINEPYGPSHSLKLSPKTASSLDWFTKDGYYITSTAYLMASVSCWIALYERDVVFLPFSKKSLTTEFFYLIEDFKRAISSKGSILWFHYVNGIGDNLVDKGTKYPITLSEFSYKLYKDELFRDYYDQLFQFLHRVACNEFMESVEETIQILGKIQKFLEKNRISIKMVRENYTKSSVI